MHPIYRLKPPTGFPQPPEHWSYSSLRSWRACPRRWWLERCSYPNTESIDYPVPLNAGAIEGQLIHEVVEQWGKSLRRGDEPGSMRSRFKSALREMHTSLKDNPRVDAARIIASVSLDACVAKAFEFVSDLEPQAASSQTNRVKTQNKAQGVPYEVEEFWISVDNPPLKGKLDRVRNGVVTDFKGGTPETGHTDQLLFYAVLWWLKYEELPVRLELRYSRSAVDVPVPGSGDISKLVGELRSEIDNARIALEQGIPTARPAAETCRYCPVRQLCDDYWRNSDTIELRLASDVKASERETQTFFGDLEISQFPADRRSDGAIIGEAMAAEIGAVQVSLGAHYCPPAAEPVSTVRLLGAKLTKSHGEYSITTAAGTEAFWTE